jgi:DNA-binding transcriptional LysR family regulator
MELRQLEYFVAVAEEASFTRAAARVRVAQPGVSAQIRRLEREFGQPLLDRSGRTVRLTEAGAAVLPYARAALGAVAGAKLAVDELAGLMRGRVAVGAVNSCSAIGLPDVLAGFHTAYPGVEIALCEANTDELLAGLRDGALDLAVVGIAGAAPEGVSTTVVVDEELCAAVRPDHPLAARDTVSLADLNEHALISLPRGTGLRACLDDACGTAGLRPHIAFEASDPTVLADLALRGLGVAILPVSSVPDALRGIEIVQPRLHSRLELAWRADGPISPAARALIDRARSELRAPSELHARSELDAR